MSIGDVRFGMFAREFWPGKFRLGTVGPGFQACEAKENEDGEQGGNGADWHQRSGLEDNQ